MYQVTNRQIARRHLLSIGTIVADASIEIRYITGGRLGSVEETFHLPPAAGDHFVFAGKSLEFVRVRNMAAGCGKRTGTGGEIPRWDGSRMPLSSELAEAVRAASRTGPPRRLRRRRDAAVRPVHGYPGKPSPPFPRCEELLIERVGNQRRPPSVFLPFEGRLVHEGIAALIAWRMARLRRSPSPCPSTTTGLNCSRPDAAPLEARASAGLLAPHNLAEDIPASLNAAEMARRQFREIARVAGLTFNRLPRPKQIRAADAGLQRAAVRCFHEVR